MGHKPWNRCDRCGRFISYDDFSSERATRVLNLPDSAYSSEEFHTLCAACNAAEKGR
jgi:hypothetical protein